MSGSKRIGGRITILSVAGALVLAAIFAGAVSAAGATVTKGEFHAFAAGAGSDLRGHVVMIRTADGRTIVSVHIQGLAPTTTYGSHVHERACANGDAGGHYRLDPAGAAVPPNEIWPGPITTNDAGVGNGKVIAGYTAGPDAVSVVVHAPGGAKIACADLG